MPWRDVFIVCRFAPPGSPLARVLDASNGTWTLDQAMLAALIDLVRDQTFSLMRQLGAKGGRPPKPIPRPWDAPMVESERIVGEVMTRTEMDEWLDEVLVRAQLNT